MAEDADDKVQEGIEHLQAAAREMIQATRSLLDAAEELIDDPKSVQDLVGSLAQAAQMAAGRFRPGGTRVGSMTTTTGTSSASRCRSEGCDSSSCRPRPIGSSTCTRTSPWCPGSTSDGRRLLVDTVAGLARGAASGRSGLLEAHGLLFDLSDEMLQLLDVDGDGLRPVVTASDLPTIQRDPRAPRRGSVPNERWRELDERWAAAEEQQRRLQLDRDAAAEALERARRNANEAGRRRRRADPPDRRAHRRLDQVDERRRQLLEAQAAARSRGRGRRRPAPRGRGGHRRRAHPPPGGRHPVLAAGGPARSGSPGPRSGIGGRGRIGGRGARSGPGGGRGGAGGRGRAPPGDPRGRRREPPAERLARVQARIEELEKRSAAFGPTEVAHVADALAQLRARQDGELVPSPAALELADQLEVLDADLTATAGIGATSQALAAGRTRLDDGAPRAAGGGAGGSQPRARPRGRVDRLELAHADVLEALEKADGRFAGGRAARRVEAARSVEQAILDELGFTSYSDYMMGYSLLNVDPEKEAALDAARAELSAAEDEWRRLEAETEAELARAERMERRRQLLEEAAALLGHKVSADEAVGELRGLRVPATIPAELVEELQRSLDEAGVAVGDEDLSRDELMLLAEAWLDEADGAMEREQGLQREMAELSEERLEALAAVEAAAARAATDDRGIAEEERGRQDATGRDRARCGGGAASQPPRGGGRRRVDRSRAGGGRRAPSRRRRARRPTPRPRSRKPPTGPSSSRPSWCGSPRSSRTCNAPRSRRTSTCSR